MKIPVELYPDEYLRIMRGRLEMTQAQLAKRLGVARQIVSYYENGIFKIPKARLDAIKQMAEI
jgi:transcriptional regulator with XRE-family HTH domain